MLNMCHLQVFEGGLSGTGPFWKWTF